MLVNKTLDDIGRQAKSAAKQMFHANTKQKNFALQQLAYSLKKHESQILEANQKDLILAQEAGMDIAMLDRLSLVGRIDGLIKDILHIAELPDPIGMPFEEKVLANGLKLHKERTPIGVLGVIYESRPNVTIDVACLAIKTSNCAILRGGSETMQTNLAFANLIQEALLSAGLPIYTIQLLENPDRKLVKELLSLHEYIDLIIPRGGAKLHAFCRENSLIPVVTGGIGICHLFVDKTADIPRALQVIKNAKTQRPTVCNALDTILVHSHIASLFIPKVIKYLKDFGVTFKIDEKSWQYIEHSEEDSYLQKAHANDWDTEWLSLVLGVKTVENLDEAIEHIQAHSTGHSDGILTNSKENADHFIRFIDSAAVYVNASTRFTDGGQFGLGAEVAISTQKIHARGPMGLPELTSYKWVVHGDYHIRG